VESISRGQVDRGRSLIQNPKRLSASALNQFCGSCHRPPEGAPGVNLDKPFSVRHQPAYLSLSVCFLRSQGALSCLTCHDPHRRLDRDSAHYDRQCVHCHASPRHSDATEQSARSRPGCVGCHMPRVTAQPYLQFSNHWIGVYRDDEKLKPRQ